MTRYHFSIGIFSFDIHAENTDKAIVAARRALEESQVEICPNTIQVELTGGAFSGMIDINPNSITINNIDKIIPLNEFLEVAF